MKWFGTGIARIVARFDDSRNPIKECEVARRQSIEIAKGGAEVGALTQFFDLTLALDLTPPRPPFKAVEYALNSLEHFRKETSADKNFRGRSKSKSKITSKTLRNWK